MPRKKRSKSSEQICALIPGAMRQIRSLNMRIYPIDTHMHMVKVIAPTSGKAKIGA